MLSTALSMAAATIVSETRGSARLARRAKKAWRKTPPEITPIYPVTFDEVKGEYTVKKTMAMVPYRVTTVSKAFFPDTFNADKVIQGMRARRVGTGEEMPSTEVLKELWAAKGAAGQDFGSRMHRKIENSITGVEKWKSTDDETCNDEMHVREMYLEFTSDAAADGWAPFKVEWTLLIPPIAGRCDLVLAQPTRRNNDVLMLWLVDWKFCKRLSTAPSAPMALYPFELYHNTDANRYTLQLNMYSHMIEQGHIGPITYAGKKYFMVSVVRRTLVVMHPSRKKARLYDCPRIPHDTMKEVWRLAKESTEASVYPFNRGAARRSIFKRPPS